MSFNSKPDTEGIPKFAERMREQWAVQRRLDDRFFDLSQKQKHVSAADLGGKDAGKPPLKALHTGYAGIVIDRDTAVISVPPFLRVNAVGMSIEKENHASSKLEPWLQGAWRQACVEPVWDRQVRDLRLFGRGWSSVLLLPRLWSSEDEEYGKLVGEWLTAVEKGDKKAAELEERIEEFKEENFPIRWQHADARVTWPQISKERRLPEVVELRSMSAAEIEADYGEDALPSGASTEGSDGAQMHDVYIYSNWVWTATMVKGGSELARIWKHNMGRSPYVLAEANIVPDNDDGIRWKSSLFDYEDSIEAQDEVMTDLRTLHRRYTTAQPHITVDPQLRLNSDPAAMAQPEKHIKFSTDEPYVSLKGEEVSLMPTPTINPASIPYMQQLQQYNETMTLNPIEQGRVLSGLSGVGFVSALQAAQTDLGPYKRALDQAANEVGELFFKSVWRLSEEYPDAPEEIFVVHEKSGKVGVTPADVKGWDKLIQARSNIMLPINRNTMMDLAVTGFDKLPLAPEFILEEFLQIENPLEQIRRWSRWRVYLALEQDRIDKTKQLAGELVGKIPMGSLNELAERIAMLPPAVQQVLLTRSMGGAQAVGPTGAGPGTVAGSAGAIRQGLSNVGRTGVPQQPSETAATQVMPTEAPV